VHTFEKYMIKYPMWMSATSTKKHGKWLLTAKVYCFFFCIQTLFEFLSSFVADIRKGACIFFCLSWL